MAFEIERGIDSIVAIHLKDTVAVSDNFPGKFKGVPFGSGCVDFPARFAQLERLKYTGPYMVEMWYSAGDGASQAAASLKWLRLQFENGKELLR